MKNLSNELKAALVIVVVVILALITMFVLQLHDEPTDIKAEGMTEGVTVDSDIVNLINSINVDKGVVVNNDIIKVRTTGSEHNGSKILINVAFDNNADNDVRISADSLMVNGVSIKSYYEGDLTVNGSGNGYLAISADDIFVSGITEVKNMSFALTVKSDSDNKVLFTDRLGIPITGQDLNYRERAEYGTKIIDSDDIKVYNQGIVRNVKENSDALVFFVENNSGKDVTTSILESKVNGENVSFESLNNDVTSSGSTGYVWFEIHNKNEFDPDKDTVQMKLSVGHDNPDVYLASDLITVIE